MNNHYTADSDKSESGSYVKRPNMQLKRMQVPNTNVCISCSHPDLINEDCCRFLVMLILIAGLSVIPVRFFLMCLIIIQSGFISSDESVYILIYGLFLCMDMCYLCCFFGVFLLLKTNPLLCTICFLNKQEVEIYFCPNYRISPGCVGV